MADARGTAVPTDSPEYFGTAQRSPAPSCVHFMELPQRASPEDAFVNASRTQARLECEALPGARTSRVPRVHAEGSVCSVEGQQAGDAAGTPIAHTVVRGWHVFTQNAQSGPELLAASRRSEGKAPNLLMALDEEKQHKARVKRKDGPPSAPRPLWRVGRAVLKAKQAFGDVESTQHGQKRTPEGVAKRPGKKRPAQFAGDPTTAFLRAAWIGAPAADAAPTQDESLRSEHAQAAATRFVLAAAQGAHRKDVTLGALLRGHVASRLPGVRMAPVAGDRWRAWDPCSSARSRWDTVCALLVLYVAVMLPLHVAFAHGDQHLSAWLIIDYAVDAIFVLDIYVSCRTGYFEYDRENCIWSLQLQGSKCLRHYLARWAVVDVLAVFPFDVLLLMGSGAEGRVSEVLSRLPRCLKLLRLPRLFRYVRKWQEVIPVSPLVLQLFSCCTIMLLFAHIAACCLILAAELEGSDACWLSVYDLIDAGPVRQYIYALFISVSHLLALGYGLSSMPGTFAELCVTLVSMFLGSVLFLIVVGMLPTVVLEHEMMSAAERRDSAHAPLLTSKWGRERGRLATALGALLGAQTPADNTSTDIERPSTASCAEGRHRASADLIGSSGRSRQRKLTELLQQAASNTAPPRGD